MASVDLKTTSGTAAGTVELDADVFGIEPNVPVMHQVVTAQLAARRAGTQSTKTRSDVRGGGAKPYRQKGTGNARQGSIRAPQFTGGGVALGPKPRKYGQKTPKKMVKLALRSALSDRAAEDKIVVVDSWGIDTPKTKTAKQALDALHLDGSVLVVLGEADEAAWLSFRNLSNVQVIAAAELNAYDVLCNDWVVFTKDVVPAADGPTAAQRVETAAAIEESEERLEVAGDADDDGVSDLVDASPHGPGSHASIEGDEMPEGYPIKGNADSMLYHLPGTSFYDRTVAEVWFDTEESAKAAGFTRPASQLKKEAEKEGAEVSNAAEGSASDESDASRGGSAADAEGAE
ncbi:MAG: 50S ribosomal protein L4 [Actinomycetota bacterium]